MPHRFTFGPFQFDASCGELRKHGTRLRLSGHSLQILEVLLEHPNHVVGREELQMRLWKGTTFVDFNHGLNAAMNKLRQTLGDSADQPRYIETVPGKGYRFIAPVSGDGVAPIVPPSNSTVLGGISSGVSPVPPEQEPSQVPAADIFPEPTETPAKVRPIWLYASVVSGLAAALVAGVWFFAGAARGPAARTNLVTQPVRYQIVIPDGMELSSTQTFSLSPDGGNLTYSAKKTGGGPFDLWVQPLDSINPRPLPIHQAGDILVFWSPDSKFLAFGNEGKLRKADLAGNLLEEIGPSPEIVGGAWGANGAMIFGTETNAIVRLDAASGKLVPVTVRDPSSERVHIFPVFLPDGRHFLYSRQSTIALKTGVFVGSLDDKPGEQSLTPLIITPFAAQFAASSDGHGVIVYQREKTLWAQRFDTTELRLIGEPRIVAERVGNTRAFGFFAVASGVLIYRSAKTNMAQLTWLDRRGQMTGTLGPAVDLFDNPPRISPDGSKIALTRFGEENTDIWVHDLPRDVSQRLTFESAPDQSPIWSPDGKKLVFSSARGGHYDLYQMSSDGESGLEMLYASEENKYASSWSGDGRFILFDTEKRDGIWMLPLDGSKKRVAVPFQQGRHNERSGVFSPDSGWIAYVSNESGQPEVYLQKFSFPLSSSPGWPKVLISRGGGRARGGVPMERRFSIAPLTEN